MKSEHGMGHGIETLTDMMSRYTYTGTTLPNFLDVERRSFYNFHPTFEDTNNLSMVIHLKIEGINFLFPGDLEINGWTLLLQNEIFSNIVRQTHVLMAPHHGRESGIHHEIFNNHGCLPHYVVMSDKCHMHDTQKTVGFYSSKAIGGPFRDSHKRYVLTTASFL